MNLDTKIQFWLLIITALVAIATFLHFVYKWYKKKFQSLKVEVAFLKDNLYPICEYTGHASNEGNITCTESFTAWVKAEITNASKDPMVIKNITTTEDNLPEKSIYGYPVKRLTIWQNEADFSEPLELPITIASSSVLHFYFMVEISVSKKLGLLISKLYGNEMNYEKINQLKKDVNREFSKKNRKFKEMFGVTVGEINFSGLSMRYDPKYDSKESSLVHEKFGRIPRNFFSSIIFDVSKDTKEFNEYLKSQYALYSMSFHFLDGQIKRKQFIVKSADWFTK